MASYLLPEDYELFHFIIRKLVQLSETSNWSQYTKMWLWRPETDLESSLQWISETFIENLESVNVIYQCFRDVAVETAWRVYWRLEGQAPHPSTDDYPEPEGPTTEALRDLVSEAIIRRFNVRSPRLGQPQSLLLNHIELFIRLKMSNDIAEDPEKMALAESYKPTCPLIFEQDIPLDVALQLLNCFLSLMRQGQGQNMGVPEVEAFWPLVLRLLESPSADNIRPLALQDAFDTLEHWLTSPEDSEELDRLTEVTFWFAHYFVDHSIKAPPGQHFHQNLAEMVRISSFLRCLSLLVNRRHFFIGLRSLDQWEQFVAFSGLDLNYLPEILPSD